MGASYKLFKALTEKHPQYIKALNEDEFAWAEMDQTFLGFVDIYRELAKIIPKSRTVIDFGCAYAPQAYYFRNHAKYIGINPTKHAVLYLKNAEYVFTSGQAVLESYTAKESDFAIINYVPDFELAKLVKAKFRDCWSFYVAGADLHVNPLPTNK